MTRHNTKKNQTSGNKSQRKTQESSEQLESKAKATSSVSVEVGPTTKQERKATPRKKHAQLAAREKELEPRVQDREREPKAQEKEREPVAQEKEPSEQESTAKPIEKATKSASKDAQVADETTVATWHKGPDTPQYRRLKYIYWICCSIGITAVLFLVVLNFGFPDADVGPARFLLMVVAYPMVFGAVALDFIKIRKIKIAHYQSLTRQSPKQQKHMQQRTETTAPKSRSKKKRRKSRR